MEKFINKQIKDLTGQMFGYLTVIEFNGRKHNKTFSARYRKGKTFEECIYKGNLHRLKKENNCDSKN